jgi:hypothetical protein
MARRLRAAALGVLLGFGVAVLPLLVPDAPAASDPALQFQVEPAAAIPRPLPAEREPLEGQRLADLIPPADCCGPGSLPRSGGT